MDVMHSFNEAEAPNSDWQLSFALALCSDCFNLGCLQGLVDMH